MNLNSSASQAARSGAARPVVRAAAEAVQRMEQARPNEGAQPSARIVAAQRLVVQMTDLVAGVREGLEANATRTTDLKADERLIQSAYATAVDLIENTRADGEPVVSLQTTGPAIQNAANAYGMVKGDGESPLIRRLGNLLTGPDGVVPTLDALRQDELFSPEESQARLARLESRLEALREPLARAGQPGLDMSA
ncbi:MAG: hypothetical protein ACK5XS_09520 [Armatimonadota bacterium]|nr:hypothetical protein [Fimbriimonadaceae bacterium]MCZ8137822.1 hypothetical protein [Fimbriimonadaceae bacterium]